MPPVSCDHDVVVIGGGVAALTAAMFAAQQGSRTAVLTDMLVGGQILSVEHVANYPGMAEPISGADLAAIVEGQAVSAGAEFVYEQATRIAHVDGRFTVSSDSGSRTAAAVIVATGSTLRTLDVPGERDLTGSGVSYCGSCDGGFFRGKTVAVVGGGDSAADEALVVAESAAEVVMVVREADLHAAAVTQARVGAHARIRVMTSCEPVEVLGRDTVTGLRLRDARSGALPDLAVAGVFVYVGLRPNTEILAHLVALKPDGKVPTSDAMETALPGLFAAGDIRDGNSGYLVNAASDGATAAFGASRHAAGLIALA